MNRWFDEEQKWKSRCLSFRRLGMMYSPDVTPEVASRRLKRWIMTNPELPALLAATGWTPSQRILNPRQVSCIVEVLEAP